MDRTLEEIASTIQHTEVSPAADRARIVALCAECREYGFDGAMVLPCWVPLAREELAGTDVSVCSAAGFPMGGDGVPDRAGFGDVAVPAQIGRAHV